MNSQKIYTNLSIFLSRRLSIPPLLACTHWRPMGGDLWGSGGTVPQNLRWGNAVAETWRRVWGDGKFSRGGPRLMNYVFFWKNLKISIFTVKISDDLFFFFSHRPGFSDFPFLFADLPYLYYVQCVVGDFLSSLSSQEKPLFQKRIPLWHLFYSVRTFARIRQHYFSKYWGGGRMHGQSPT